MYGSHIAYLWILQIQFVSRQICRSPKGIGLRACLPQILHVRNPESSTLASPQFLTVFHSMYVLKIGHSRTIYNIAADESESSPKFRLFRFIQSQISHGAWTQNRPAFLFRCSAESRNSLCYCPLKGADTACFLFLGSFRG